MPIYKRTVEYYTCEYKCGIKAMEKLKMADHEERCFCNPKNKACRICVNYKADGEIVACEIIKLYMLNEDKTIVYNLNGSTAWNDNVNHFATPLTKRPFPTLNCPHFILDKKAY